MSDRVKGARKARKEDKKFILGDNFSLGKYSVKVDLAIPILMAVIYAFLQLAAAVTGNRIALILTELMFLVFLVLAYLARKDLITGIKKFEYIAYVFLGLSIVSLLWQLLITYIIVDTNSFGGGAPWAWALLVGGFNAVVSIVIIATLIYIENISLEKIFVRVGDSKGILMGVAGIILCFVFAVIGSLLLSSGISLSSGKFAQIVGVVLVFGIICGVYEELWFRGLLLSKIVPILGESSGNIFQAAVFGVFEAMVFVALMPKMSYTMLAFFILIGAMVGYYWGRATLKTGSLLSSMLLHAGLYILILLPLLASSVT